MYPSKNKPVKVSKEGRILTKICKECDRYRKIPQSFCNDCWSEMYNTIKQKENNND